MGLYLYHKGQFPMVSKKVHSLEFLLLFAIFAVIRDNMATEAYINHPSHILSFIVCFSLVQ